MTDPTNLSLDSTPADILNCYYTNIIRGLFDVEAGILPSAALEPYPKKDGIGFFSAEATSVQTRDPANEEKIRLIILGACQLWLYLSRNAQIQSRLLTVIYTVSDPGKWKVIADLIWGA